VGSLLLGVMVDGALRHCGSVGSGLTTSSRADWFERLSVNECDDSPFDSTVVATAGRQFRWSAPLFVVEVAFGEWTPDSHLRHPVYLGWRADKDPKGVIRER
jgi:bifunctional non-homologous end joining protein LigD